jgi:hypothetical protein
MATITLERVSKVYPNGFQAVNEVNLTIADGEFMDVAEMHCFDPVSGESIVDGRPAAVAVAGAS